MRKTMKLTALLLIMALSLGLLAGCGENARSANDPSSPEISSEHTEEDSVSSLVVDASSFAGQFSPFFASGEDDQNVVRLTQAYLMITDRVSDPVLSGIEGETRSYNGADYTYTGISNISVTENDDGTVCYDIDLRDDVQFSDGEPLTIDDVIFSMYVCLDPTYDGATALGACPIQGLEEYQKSISNLALALASAGEDNTDFEFWTEDQQKAFWAAVHDGGVKFAQEIVDFMVNEGGAEEGNVAEAANGWGFSLEEGATAEDFFMAIGSAYGWSFAQMEAESVGTALSDLIPEDVYGYSSIGVPTGQGADYVSGIERTGDYSLRVTATELNATMIYQFAFPIAPLHYYGDPEKYDYDSHKFGFDTGDLSPIRDKSAVPLGAGPYVFKAYSDNTVFLVANSLYYKGEPNAKNLCLMEVQEANKITGIVSGALDITSPTYSTEVASQIAEQNGTEDLAGPVITTELIDYRGYGYIGINANNVRVGDDTGSEASKNLRKAFATIFSVYRDEAVSAYYGDTASVINYPISNTSWAAPQPADEGYQVCYSTDVSGAPIYTEEMSDEDKCDAALAAALGFLEAAGFTVEDGKVTEAPEGARLEYQVSIGGGGAGDHPGSLLMQKASEALAAIGVTLTVSDLAQPADLYDSYASGKADIWCAAWQSSSDPDMTQLYHSTKGVTNYYRIADADLDQLVDDALLTTDQSDRKSLYHQAMEIVLDWGVEIPFYQRSEAYLVSSERVDTSSLPADMTPYWTWMDEIEKVVVK